MHSKMHGMVIFLVYSQKKKLIVFVIVIAFTIGLLKISRQYSILVTFGPKRIGL